MTTTAAYLRISSDPTESRIGVERQRREIADLAGRLETEVGAWHEDNDVSAYRGKRRPAFEALVADLEAGRVATLLAWDQDRIARDVVDWERVLRACQRHGVRVATVTDGAVDLGTVGGRLSSRVRAVVGRTESEQKAERIRAAVRERAAAGRAHGRVLYGWRRVYEFDTQGVRIRGAWHDVLDDAAAEVIRETSRRVLAGEPIRRLCAEYEGRGIPSPTGGKTWAPTSMRAILLRPANAGLRVHHGAILGPAEAPAILDRGEWERLVALLGDRSRRTISHNSTKHLLTGIARCGKCGGPVRAKGSMYQCEKVGCVGRRMGAVDDLVTRVIVGRLGMPDAIGLLAVDDQEAERAAREVAELRARLDRLADDYADGILDRDQMRRASERMRPRLAEAEARARRTSTHQADVLAGLIGPDVAERWEALPIHRRRAAVDALLEVTILPLGRGHGGRAPFQPESVRLDWKGAE